MASCPSEQTFYDAMLKGVVINIKTFIHDNPINGKPKNIELLSSYLAMIERYANTLANDKFQKDREVYKDFKADMDKLTALSHMIEEYIRNIYSGEIRQYVSDIDSFKSVKADSQYENKAREFSKAVGKNIKRYKEFIPYVARKEKDNYTSALGNLEKKLTALVQHVKQEITNQNQDETRIRKMKDELEALHLSLTKEKKRISEESQYLKTQFDLDNDFVVSAKQSLEQGNTEASNGTERTFPMIVIISSRLHDIKNKKNSAPYVGSVYTETGEFLDILAPAKEMMQYNRTVTESDMDERLLEQTREKVESLQYDESLQSVSEIKKETISIIGQKMEALESEATQQLQKQLGIKLKKKLEDEKRKNDLELARQEEERLKRLALLEEENENARAEESKRLQLEADNKRKRIEAERKEAERIQREQEEEERKKQEDIQHRLEESKRLQLEADEKRRIQEEAERKKIAAEEEKRRQDDMKRKQEEEKTRKRQEAERLKIAKEEGDRLRRIADEEEERKERAAEEERKKRAAEEEERKKRVAEEERKKRAAEDEERNKRVAEEERKKRAAEEERKRRTEEESRIKRLAEEEERKKRAAEEERKKRAAEEELKKRAAEEARLNMLAEEEERKKRLAEEEERRKRAVDEERKKRADEEEQKKRAAEEARLEMAAEEEKRKRLAEEEAEQKRLAAEEERKERAAEEDRKKRAAEEERKKRAAEEARLKRIAEEEEREKREAEAARLKRIAEEEAEQKRLAEEEEQQRLAAEEERKKRAAEEARLKRIAEEKEAERKKRAAEEAERKKRAAEEEERIRKEAEDERERVLQEEQAKKAASLSKRANTFLKDYAVNSGKVWEETLGVTASGDINVYGTNIRLANDENNVRFKERGNTWVDYQDMDSIAIKSPKIFQKGKLTEKFQQNIEKEALFTKLKSTVPSKDGKVWYYNFMVPSGDTRAIVLFEELLNTVLVRLQEIQTEESFMEYALDAFYIYRTLISLFFYMNVPDKSSEDDVTQNVLEETRKRIDNLKSSSHVIVQKNKEGRMNALYLYNSLRSNFKIEFDPYSMRPLVPDECKSVYMKMCAVNQQIPDEYFVNLSRKTEISDDEFDNGMRSLHRAINFKHYAPKKYYSAYLKDPMCSLMIPRVKMEDSQYVKKLFANQHKSKDQIAAFLSTFNQKPEDIYRMMSAVSHFNIELDKFNSVHRSTRSSQSNV